MGCGATLTRLPLVEPGFLLASRYEIRDPLGAGGMGMVYKAHDRLLQETVAIKVLRPEAALAPQTAARFISEIKLARAVSHKNVARIHEYGEDRGIRYISMAFVDGVDLKSLLRKRGPFPLPEAFEIATHVAEGLHAIHEEGIVHRDLKSSNIMLDGRGVVRLMDFGLAKPWLAEHAEDMTASGQIVGTPDYMSPEQVRGLMLDRRSDIYSLAVVIYELFTGRTPFRGDTQMATLLMHVNDPPPLEGPPAERIPRAVVPLLRRALAKDPEERFATALEMGLALEHARAASGAEATLSLTAASTPSPVGSGSGPSTLKGRRRPAFPGLVWALGVAAFGGLLLTLLAGRGVGRAMVGVVPDGHSPAKEPGPAAAPTSAPVKGSTAPSPVPVPPATASLAKSSAPTRSAREALPQKPDAGAVRATPGAPVADVRRPAEIADAQAEERKQLAARVEAKLADAGTALEAQRYDAAIALYEEIIQLDPHHQMARIGRATAVNAKIAARAPAAPGRDSGRAFIAGKTSVTSADAGPDQALSQAFEDTPGVEVQRDTPARPPPGRIEFEARPEAPRAGERYTLKVFLANPGKTPIEIRDMVVTNTVNGRRQSGSVTPPTRTVAPEQKALVLSLSEFIAEGTETWSLEVLVRTTGGDTFRNQITWK